MQPAPDALRGTLRHAGVTARELDVFWLVGDRLHNREIAESLHVSERTVESHVSSLLRKLGGTNRLSLVDAAVRLRNRRVSGGALPRPLSSFVGRGTETHDLLRLVPVHRLVTLTGPAGAGKTRLALHLATCLDALPPAVLVDLATVAPGADVERVFADALGVAGEERRVRAQLREALAEGPHWLVVDNCEHVAHSTAALLADLLTTAAELSVLATSHGPLNVAGEVVYELSPLPLPPEADDPSVVLSAASGRLFADRAATAIPGFTVTAHNARAVAAVCRGLDGLPLAIELAAARLRVFSPAELLSHLHDRLALLTNGAHGMPSRHRTLEAALQWSYDLLDDDERLLFERCSVFPGDFEYDSVVDVLAYPPLRRADLARLFPRLLDRSLVSSHREGQTTSYRMLDSIRHFADSRLALRGEHEILHEHHALHHLRRGAATLADLQGADQVGALVWFARRWPDLRAAMHWALEREKTEPAWEFLAGIGTGWEILGVRGELFDWLNVLLDRPLPPAPLGVRAAVTVAFLLCYQDTRLALTYAQHAYDEAQQTGADDHDLALASLSLGWATMHNRQYPSAIGHFRQAVAEFLRLADDWHHALALQGLGDAVQDPEVRLAHLARSAELFGRMRDHVKRANCLNQMASGSIAVRAHLDEAQTWLTEAHRLAQLTGNHHERLHAEIFRACLDQCRGQHEFAGARFGRLLAEFRRIGDRRCMSRCLLGLGQAAVRDGDHEMARGHLTECILTADGTGDALEMAVGLRLLAASCHATGESQYAALLFGAADEAIEQLNPARRDALAGDHELRVALRDELGPDALASALADGRRTTLDQLLAR
ncbi:LuxR C-terminal-related transcriptional regulator [Micromonospora purpureochromogenes]|uniref:ATP-binding protein n=1 Tax=Micromonospora purpureochromogenes TaxID=47872 RepID=UPI00332B4E76